MFGAIETVFIHSFSYYSLICSFSVPISSTLVDLATKSVQLTVSFTNMDWRIKIWCYTALLFCCVNGYPSIDCPRGGVLGCPRNGTEALTFFGLDAVGVVTNSYTTVPTVFVSVDLFALGQLLSWRWNPLCPVSWCSNHWSSSPQASGLSTREAIEKFDRKQCEKDCRMWLNGLLLNFSLWCVVCALHPLC